MDDVYDNYQHIQVSGYIMKCFGKIIHNKNKEYDADGHHQKNKDGACGYLIF